MPTIRFHTSGTDVDFAEGETVNVLRVSIRNDGGLPWKCASGLCGTDRITIVDGAEHLEAPRKRERECLGELVDDGVRLACQTYVNGDVTVIWDPDQKGIAEDSKAGKRLKAMWLADEDGA
jgi:ferredoxin